MIMRAFDVKPIRGPWHIGSNLYSTRYIPGTNRLYERARLNCLPNDAGHGGRDVHNDTDDKTWRAVWDGVIHRYSWDDYGNHIGLVNSDGIEAFYAHGSAIHVSDGQAVKAGTDLGIIGQTGNTSGPHLHFEVRTTAFQWCTAVDPTSLLLAQSQPPQEEDMFILKDMIHVTPGQNPNLYISLGSKAKVPISYTDWDLMGRPAVHEVNKTGEPLNALLKAPNI